MDVHAQLVHHVLVAGEAAGRQDDGLVGVELRVGAVLKLADDAGHGRALAALLDELHGRGVVHDLAAMLLQGLQQDGHGHLGTHRVGGVLHGRLVGGVARAGRVVEVLGPDALVGKVDGHVRALGLHEALVPVGEGAGVVRPLADEVLVALALVVAQDVADDEFLVDADPHVLLNLRVQAVEVAGPHAARARALHHEHARAVQGQLDGGDDARVAAAHHHGVVGGGGAHLVGHRLGLGVPGLLGRVGRGLVGQRRLPVNQRTACGNGCGSHTGSGTARNERTARDTRKVHRFLLEHRRAPIPSKASGLAESRSATQPARGVSPLCRSPLRFRPWGKL